MNQARDYICRMVNELGNVLPNGRSELIQLVVEHVGLFCLSAYFDPEGIAMYYGASATNNPNRDSKRVMLGSWDKDSVMLTTDARFLLLRLEQPISPVVRSPPPSPPRTCDVFELRSLALSCKDYSTIFGNVKATMLACQPPYKTHHTLYWFNRWVVIDLKRAQIRYPFLKVLPAFLPAETLDHSVKIRTLIDQIAQAAQPADIPNLLQQFESTVVSSWT